MIYHLAAYAFFGLICGVFAWVNLRADAGDGWDELLTDILLTTGVVVWWPVVVAAVVLGDGDGVT